MRSVFATITLMADEPFRVGETIRYGDYQGVAEDMGLRSTDLRLPDGHPVTLSNQEIAGRSVENLSHRKHIRRSAEIHLSLDTPDEKVERAVAIVRERLTGQEIADSELPPRCFLHELGPQVFSIRFVY